MTPRPLPCDKAGMIDAKTFDPAAYVAAMAPAVGLTLPPERQARVAAALALVVKIGAPALEHEVAEDVEPAPVFDPGVSRP